MGNDLDLHMHSAYSDDGEFTPTELVRLCRLAGIETMAISDHNCVKANREAQGEAERLHIQYIPAVELDCTFHDRDMHLLGYQIRYQSPDFEKVEDHIRTQAVGVSLECLRLTMRLGFHITEDELNAISGKGYWKDVWAGEAFAEVLLHKPEYLQHEILRPYRTGGVRSDNPYANFYWDYYSQGKPCYAKMNFPSAEEALSLIKDNGGVAVLAHPGMTLKNDFGLFDDLVALGMDGVEAYSSYHDRATARHFCREAQKHALIVTCGSDFHGKAKPSIQLGKSGCFIPPFFPVRPAR
ncbi:MAG: PHP domain-containing protein [Clostridia bacterium]|nr:PHP domain-containing protein [Clostridia bacterium]